jgi:hypothetical protein
MSATTPIRTSVEKLNGDAGTITLKTWRPSKQAGDPVFLLPNGYGLLPYAESVCEELAARGKMVYSLDLRGQGGNPGEFSVPGAAEDIASAVSHVSEQEPSFHLLVHCSSALPLILLGEDAENWRAVKSVLLYHYLAEPRAHLDRFRMKCARYGVRVADDVGRLDCYGPEAYRDIPVPLAVVHPNIPANLHRADMRQIRELAEKAGIGIIATPESGYDINTNPQKTAVREAVDRDILPLVG